MKEDSFRILILSILLMVSSLCTLKAEDEILQLPTNSVKVTYIANAGYLIESSGNRHIICSDLTGRIF